MPNRNTNICDNRFYLYVKSPKTGVKETKKTCKDTNIHTQTLLYTIQIQGNRHSKRPKRMDCYCWCVISLFFFFLIKRENSTFCLFQFIQFDRFKFAGQKT